MCRRAIFLVTLFVLATAGFTFAQIAPTLKKGPEISMSATDDRQAVVVSEATRVFVLTEMRSMLGSVQGVTEAIGKRDWQGAIDAAEKSGLKAFQGLAKQIMMELPEDFRIMGREAHISFDEVATAASTNPDASAVSAKLADTLQFCIACHRAYRFAVRN